MVYLYYFSHFYGLNLELFFSDGLILNLLRKNKDITSCISNFKKINDDEVILRVSKLTIDDDMISLLKEYEAIEYISRVEDNEDEIQSKKTDDERHADSWNVPGIYEYVCCLFSTQNPAAQQLSISPQLDYCLFRRRSA